MMPPVNIWTIGAVLAAFALLATLRQSVPSLAGRRLGIVVDFLTSSVWLVPLILAMYFALGLMLAGQLSPWPPETRAIWAQKWGAWAGITGFILVVIADIWLVWTPSMVARRFAGPESREAVKALPWFNVIFGIAVILMLQFLIPRG